MDALTATLGALTLILGLILSGIALANRITRGIKGQVREVLVDTGIIRPGPDVSNWPNGWNNLPDSLEGLQAELLKLGEHNHNHD